MINIEKARELAENKMVKVNSSLDSALDEAIIKAIEQWKRKIDIALSYKDCSEDDHHVASYLKQLWFENISVSSDFPWYNESYEWKTFIKFNF